MTEEKELLFERNTKLVEKIASRLNYGYVDKADLIQAGLMGLYNAILKYDSSYQNSFETFATYHILGEMKTEMRNNQLIKLSKKIIKLIKYIKEHPELSITEIAKDCDCSEEDVLIAYGYKNDIVSLNAQNDDNDELIELIGSYDKKNIINDILTGIFKKIIELRYYKNLSQVEVAKRMNLSQSKVSRIEKIALEKLRKYL